MREERGRDREVRRFQEPRTPAVFRAEAQARGYSYATGASEVRGDVTYYQYATHIDEESQEPCGNFLMLGYAKGRYHVAGELACR